MATSTHHRHPRPLCRICGRALPLSRRILVFDALKFCDEHWSQYKTRQREGVASQGLHPDWSDTLANWHERPAELDEEARMKRHKATPLYFSERYEDWLLFTRHYIFGGIIDLPQTLRLRGIVGVLPRRNRRFATLRTGKRSFADKILHGTREYRGHRSSDCLAVNQQTGEIRRFVDVQSETVLDDLQGIRPAPYQDELASFWGNPQPTGIQERFRRQYMDERHRVRIPALVHLAAFPIYGIADQTSDFSVSGLGTSGGVWGGIKSICFHFSSPRYPQQHEHFDVSSDEPRQSHIVYHPEIATTSLFMRSGLNEIERAQVEQPSLWEGEIVIDGVTFTGEIRCWSQPCQLSLFRLTSANTVLSGTARGPAQDEVFQLLKGLRAVNEQEEILARYQRETDERIRQLFGRVE